MKGIWDAIVDRGVEEEQWMDRKEWQVGMEDTNDVKKPIHTCI
jgi:hypothetical protein